MVTITNLLATKLYIPRVRSSLVERPRLLERLHQGLQGKLTLISALPGSGKTTLLSAWEVANPDKHYPLAWLSIDESDNDSTRFWSYVAKAIETLSPNIHEDIQNVLALLHSFPSPPIEAVLITLLNAIATTIPEDFVLVLDDYHCIIIEAIHNAVAFLLDAMPPQMHLVLITRVDPPLPLARLRAHGQLIEIRTSDLRFTARETLAYLQHTMKLQVSPEDATSLAEHTEGWIAGLQLAVLSSQGHGSQPDFLRTFHGGQRYVLEYLAQEVLQQQPTYIQEFLLHTAILRRFSAELCNAVTERTDSQDILQWLDKANLFLISLDQEQHWYRYHALFSEFLLRSLRTTQTAAAISALHIRAALWYEQQQVMNEAVHHMLASGDFEQAAALIERIARTVWMRGESSTLQCWLQELPEQVLRSHPQLGLFLVWSLIGTNQTDEAQKHLEDIILTLQASTADNQHSVSTSGDGNTANELREETLSAEQATMQTEITILQATLARFSNDVSRTLTLSQQALQHLPAENSILKSVNTLNLGHAYRLRGENEAASAAFKQVIVMGRTIGNTYTVLLALNTLIQLHIEHGTLHTAEKYCQESLQFAARHNCLQLPIMSQTYVKEGELLYQRNKLEAAAQRLDEGIELGQNKGGLRFLLEGYMLQSRVLHAQGEEAHALEVLARATEIAREHSSSWQLLQIAAQHARILLNQGQLASALLWLERSSLSVSDAPTYTHEFEYLTLVRLLLAQGKAKEVISLLERLRQSASTGKRNGIVIEILLLQSLANYALNQLTEAFTALERALLLAQSEGYIRLFVDEGRRVAQLLTRFLAWQESTPGHSNITRSLQSYVHQLLEVYTSTNTDPLASSSQKGTDAAHQQKQFPLIEALGERETQVLHYLAAGLSNQAIAEEMVVALSTVKSHLKSIYRKLDVDSRTHAIARARELHII